ncbi:hypothetical protein, partial [Escherichia coli]|uniref:hypothetical protein n=1 Tax=Escherichia coli TaxID=562 RepID=UPI001BFD2908
CYFFAIQLLPVSFPHLHLVHVYTSLVLRDWSGAAPGTRLYRFSSRSGLTAIFFFSSLPATL